MKPYAGQGIVTRKVGDYWITWNANLHSIGELNPQNSAAGETRQESYNRFLNKFLFGRRENPIKRGKEMHGALDAPQTAFGERENKYKRGQCYMNAYQYASEHEREGWRIVHAIVTGQGGIAGVRFGHAWVERCHPMGFIEAHDPAADVRIPAELYRQIGEASDLRVYTLDDARREMVKHGHYGPWDEKIGASAHAGKKSRRKNPDDEPLEVHYDQGNPRWLKEEQEENLARGMRVTHAGTRVPARFGPITASLNRPVLIPVTWLENLPGLTGEDRFTRQESFDWLLREMRDNNRLPLGFRDQQYLPFIQVWQDGMGDIS